MWRGASRCCARRSRARTPRGSRRSASPRSARPRSPGTPRAAAPSPLRSAGRTKRTQPRVAELRAAGDPHHDAPVGDEVRVVAAPRARRARRATRGAPPRDPDAWLGFRLTAARPRDRPGQASCTGLYELARGAGTRRPGALRWSDRRLPEVVATAKWATTPRRAARRGASRSPRVRATSRPRPSPRAPARPATRSSRSAPRPCSTYTRARSAALPGPRCPSPSHSGASPGGRDALCLEGSVVTAGAALDWLVALGLLAERRISTRAPARCLRRGGAFVPALQGLGTPSLDVRARGLLGGLTRGRRPPRSRAPCSRAWPSAASTCATRSASSARPLRVDGGLARSDPLLQLVADFAGRPCCAPRSSRPRPSARPSSRASGRASTTTRRSAPRSPPRPAASSPTPSRVVARSSAGVGTASSSGAAKSRLPA